MSLQEWTESYARARSAFHQDLVSSEWNHNVLTIVRETMEEFYVVNEALGVDVLAIAQPLINCTIVTIANSHNVQVLLNDWGKFVRSHCKILFVKANGGKVILNPGVHDRIADPETLTQGIKSLFGEE